MRAFDNSPKAVLEYIRVNRRIEFRYIQLETIFRSLRIVAEPPFDGSFAEALSSARNASAIPIVHPAHDERFDLQHERPVDDLSFEKRLFDIPLFLTRPVLYSRLNIRRMLIFSAVHFCLCIGDCFGAMLEIRLDGFVFPLLASRRVCDCSVDVAFTRNPRIDISESFRHGIILSPLLPIRLSSLSAY